MKAFVVPSGVSLDNYSINSLYHPKSGKATYLLDNKEKLSILEIQQLQTNGSYCSWFCDQNVIEDGSIYMCSPVDPLFILLPLFEKYTSSSYRNFQDIITEENSEDIKLLRDAEKFVDFAVLCDAQIILENNYWKLNEEKTLQWLGTKFDRLKSKLDEINFSETSAVSSFVQVKSEIDNSARITKSALGFLSEYISLNWIEKLQIAQGISDASQEDKRTSYTTMDDVMKYAQQRPITDNFAFGVMNKKTSTKQTKAAKLDKSGMGSLKSFFGAKSTDKK